MQNSFNTMVLRIAADSLDRSADMLDSLNETNDFNVTSEANMNRRAAESLRAVLAELQEG
jgi:hypothetical protein